MLLRKSKAEVMVIENWLRISKVKNHRKNHLISLDLIRLMEKYATIDKVELVLLLNNEIIKINKFLSQAPYLPKLNQISTNYNINDFTIYFENLREIKNSFNDNYLFRKITVFNKKYNRKIYKKS